MWQVPKTTRSVSCDCWITEVGHTLIFWTGFAFIVKVTTLTNLYFLGEKFVPPTVAPEVVKTTICLPNYGVDYTGDLSVTLGGHTCIQWSSPQAKALSKDKEFIPEVQLTGNKCRNPDNDPEGPWCYVHISGNITVDYCDLDLCGMDWPRTDCSYLIPLLCLTVIPRMLPRGSTSCTGAGDRNRRQGALCLSACQEIVFQSSDLWGGREQWVFTDTRPDLSLTNT